MQEPYGGVHTEGACRDVADPWYTGDFEEAFQDILEGCEAMLNELSI